MRTAHRLAAAAAAVLATAGSALVGAARASAAGELGLSWDGRTWQPDLTGPIFHSPQRWVPGDSASGRFYVRNQSADPASLAVEYRLPPSELMSADDLQIQARIDTGDWVTLAEGTTWLPVTDTTLAVGNQLPVDVRAVFEPASANRSQGESTPLSFHVILSGDVLVPGGPSSSRPAAAGDRHLSDTGVHDIGLLVVTGGGLVGIGLALIVPWRRGRENSDG